MCVCVSMPHGSTMREVGSSEGNYTVFPSQLKDICFLVGVLAKCVFPREGIEFGKYAGSRVQCRLVFLKEQPHDRS